LRHRHRRRVRLLLIRLSSSSLEEHAMIDDLNTALAKAHRLDLTREAGRSRLVRLAMCCQPSYLRDRTAHLVSWFKHGQIGTGIDDLSAAPITARGCCA